MGAGYNRPSEISDTMVITTRRSRIRERRVPRVCDTAVLRTTITTSTLLSGSFATYSSFSSLLSPCFSFTTMAASRGDRKPYNVSNPLFNVLGGPYSLHSDLVLFLCYSLTPFYSFLATEPSTSRCKRWMASRPRSWRSSCEDKKRRQQEWYQQRC